MPKSRPEKPHTAPANGSEPRPAKGDKNEGEGNRTAARRYDAAVQKTIKSGRVPEKAREAARALDGPEGAELRRAEAEAKRGKTN